jgi:hypothetical protein
MALPLWQTRQTLLCISSPLSSLALIGSYHVKEMHRYARAREQQSIDAPTATVQVIRTQPQAPPSNHSGTAAAALARALVRFGLSLLRPRLQYLYNTL